MNTLSTLTQEGGSPVRDTTRVRRRPGVSATISAVVICGNEEANIAHCLASVSWCDEIVVIDSMSADRTAEIAGQFTAKVIRRPWPGYVAQKNFALEQATCDWVISLDADERCTPELQDAIEEALAHPAEFVAFRARRLVRYLGRWIRHGGWYPDRKVRIVRRGKARWEGIDPHDKLIADGPVGDLDADIHHFTYKDFSHQIRTINHFSDIATAEWLRTGANASLLKMFFHPPVKFFDCFITRRGFLDGMAGFIIAVASAFYVFSRHVKQWEAKSQARDSGR